METYFNVSIEFDPQKVDQIIHKTIQEKGKGYVCSIESNNLTIANTNETFNNVVNGALVNICDGSNLAWILGKIHKQKFKSYIGADLFTKYVNKCKYNQYFLGNTEEVLRGLKKNLSKIDPKISSMPFEELPFRKVHEFDYPAIAQKINEYKPDIIWVSLGAPKQEEFMSLLLPHLNQGVMFGFGAIFNFNAGVGSVKRAPKLMLKFHLEWLFRAFEEPRKNMPRYARFIKILPGLIRQEYKKLNKNQSL